MTQKRSKKRQFLVWIAFMVSLALVISMAKSVAELVQQNNRLQKARFQLNELEEEKANLEAEKKYYQSEEFVEREARDKLNMSRPGEAVVVMPPPEEVVYSGPSEIELPVWRQWLAYFGLN